uniref:arginyltransferase n=1 Tax=Acrobeloides nanus TaxID=290746 RepID=A0A914EHT7_9BILA
MNELIDMGWRREGNNLYKTYMECCHTYALRLNAQNFKLSKNHRKILNHINDFFKFGNETSENTGRNIKNSKQNKGTNNQQDTSLEAYIRRIFENSEAHKLEHFGTFHRQYLIDGKLVGVEVFDTLLNYVVGQTLYYDPDLSHLNLGTFMILNQILYTQQLSKILEKPIYFSSGLYNHCFKKHHYKLQFASEILCCDTQKWITLDKSLLQMLDNEEKIMCEDSSSIEKPEIFSIPCLYNGKVVIEEFVLFALVQFMNILLHKKYYNRYDSFYIKKCG